MTTQIIQTRQITKTYQSDGEQVPALRGVDLAIEQGEFVAVMGPSGCGKSTLLHILGGLDSPTSGEVLINGQRIDTYSETQKAILRRKQVGFVFQAFNLVGNLTIRDNVELPGLVAGLSPALARQRREILLEQLGLKNRANHAPAQLSGGEKQRAALARALVNQPMILLADEPTGNLDSQNTIEVLRLLQQTHRQGQTILIVTHDPNVASIAQRVIFMKDGQITSQTVLQKTGDSRALLAVLLESEDIGSLKQAVKE